MKSSVVISAGEMGRQIDVIGLFIVLLLQCLSVARRLDRCLDHSIWDAATEQHIGRSTREHGKYWLRMWIIDRTDNGLLAHDYDD
jgi:hypothetical protein